MSRPLLASTLVLLCVTGSAQAQSTPVEILRIDRDGFLTWVNTSQPTGIYRVEFTDSLPSGWEVVPGLESVLASVNPVTVPTRVDGVDERFFRVQWLDAPLADSRFDFSNVQGQGGWEYGYFEPAGDEEYDPVSLQLMGTFQDDAWYVDTVDYLTLWSRERVHPNGTETSGGRLPVEQWAVLRWTSPETVNIQFELELEDLNGEGGNGLVFHVFRNGESLLSATLDNGFDTVFEGSAAVQAGDQIDFVIDPRDSNDLSDITRHRFVIRELKIGEVVLNSIASIGGNSP